MDDPFFLDEPEAAYPGERAIKQAQKELALPEPSAADVEEMRPLVAGDEAPEEIVLSLPEAVLARNHMLRRLWGRLSERQRAYLLALRDSDFNERAAVRALEGGPLEVSRMLVRRNWGGRPDFVQCRKFLMDDAARHVQDKSALIMRANLIAQNAIEPKPILYHGVPTGFYEINGDVALRANEQILKVAGHLKAPEVARVRVRIVNLAGPEDDIEPIEGTAVEVDVSVPDFLE